MIQDVTFYELPAFFDIKHIQFDYLNKFTDFSHNSSTSEWSFKITIHLWFWPECVTAAFYSHTNPLLHRAASGWSFSRSVLNLSCAGSETVRVCVRIVEWKALEDVGDVSGYDDVSEKRGREREMARAHDRCRCHMSGIVFLYAWSS